MCVLCLVAGALVALGLSAPKPKNAKRWSEIPDRFSFVSISEITNSFAEIGRGFSARIASNKQTNWCVITLYPYSGAPKAEIYVYRQENGYYQLRDIILDYPPEKDLDLRLTTEPGRLEMYFEKRRLYIEP